MNLYIETENGQAKNHPADEKNLLEAFGSIPIHWETFIRIEKPILDVYEILDSNEAVYLKVNNVWTDVWNIREMTVEEKSAKQQAVINAFNQRDQASNWSTWVFDEATCKMKPPILRPDADQTKIDAGIMTFWCGAENNWKDTPIYPNDENQYNFDFFAWQWVQEVN